MTDVKQTGAEVEKHESGAALQAHVIAELERHAENGNYANVFAAGMLARILDGCVLLTAEEAEKVYNIVGYYAPDSAFALVRALLSTPEAGDE